MAVQVSKSGGIYIEISGDYSKLQADLKQVESLAKAAGQDISNSLSGAMSPKEASRAATSLSRYMSTAANSAKALKAELSGQEATFREIGKSIGVAEQDLAKFVAMQKQMYQNQAAKSFVSNLRNVQRLTGATDAEMNKLSKSLGGTGREFTKAARTATAFGSCIEDVITKYGGMLIGAQAISSAASAIGQSVLQVDKLNKSYTTIYDSAEAANRQLNYIYETSHALGLQFQSTAEATKTFFAAGKDTALEQSLNSIFKAVSGAGTALALSQADMSGIFLALGQMISKGKVQAEELRGQLGERLPGAFQLAAKAMGVTTAELDKMLTTGQVTADQLLPKLAIELEKAFGAKAIQAAQGLQGQLNRLSTEWERFKGSLADSNALASAVGNAAETMKLLADNGETVGSTIKQATVTIGAGASAWGVYQLAIKGVCTTAGEALTAETALRNAAVQTAKSNLTAAIQAQAAISLKTHHIDQIAKHTIGTKLEERAVAMLTIQRQKLAAADAQVTAAEMNLAAAQRAATSTTIVAATAKDKLLKAGSSLLGMFGGPLGLAFTLTAGSVAYFATRETEADEIARRYGVTLNDISNEYAKLATKAQDAAEQTRLLSEAQKQAALARIRATEKTESEIRRRLMERNVLTDNIAVDSTATAEVELRFKDDSVKSAYNTYKQVFEEFKNSPIDSKSIETAFKAFGDLDAAMKDVAASDTSFWGTTAAEANKLGNEIRITMQLLQGLANSINALSQQKVSFVLPDSQIALGEHAAAMQKARTEVAEAFAKTEEGKRKQLQETFNQADKNNKLLKSAESAAVLKKAREDLQKSIAGPRKTGGGGRSSEFSENRAVKLAEDAYNKAKDAAEQLRLKNIELQESLRGNTLEADLAKVGRQYQAQVDAIEKDTRDLLSKQEEWKKKGLLTSEVQGFIDQYSEQNRVRLEALDIERQYNEELAKRASMESVLGFSVTGQEEHISAINSLTEAYNQGYLSLEQYQIRLNNVGLELARLHQDMGISTFAEDVSLALSQITESYQGVTIGLTESFGGFFQSFTQGFSDSIGRAVVESDNLAESLHNVAKSAVSNLISSLVQLGLQYVVNAALGQSVAASTISASTAMGVASAKALEGAYAGAAAAASLASFGANAAPAMAGITTTYALTKGLAATPGFKDGGYTGNIGTDQIAGVVHGGEYVFDAHAVQQIGVSNLEALQKGSVGSRSATSGSSPLSPSLNVSIENYGTSKSFEVQQLSESEIRIIARDEAQNVTREYAPRVIANSMTNPNSLVSKSFSRNTKTERRR